jgi:hypothetical protein
MTTGAARRIAQLSQELARQECDRATASLGLVAKQRVETARRGED